MVFNSKANVFAVGLDVSIDPAACLTSQHLRQIKTRHTPAAHLAARLIEYEVEYHGCCRMHDPLALVVLLDSSLLDFTLANVEVIGGNDWDRGVTRILPPDSSQLSVDNFQPMHIASAVDGSRFLELFLSRVLEE